MGGGIGMGNTCKPMAFSFQCMKKSTTNKKIIIINKKKRKKKLCSYQSFTNQFSNLGEVNIDLPGALLFMASKMVKLCLKECTAF